MLAPQTVLQNRYRIVKQLGQGGMGAVFEAVDERLDTTVALKETLFADERLSKQFEREARLLARLHHPALPRVSDHFSQAEGQFLVMQYIAGEDLAEMITRRRGPFPPDQVLTWADQLLDALDYLHTQQPQIIHRDIKPQNLKLTARGQIILLDFGLAKGQASEVSRITTSASIFGYTPNYAPLEQVQGLGTDPRSDIYSLSATLYHLLTGEKPPDALTRAAAIVNGQPDPLKAANEVNDAVSPETAAVLNKAMSQNREQRYSTAATMRRALQGRDDVVTIASRTEANTVLFPPSAPTIAENTQVNANLATLAAGANVATIPAGETTVVRAAEPKRKGFAARFGIAGIVVLVLAAGALGFYAFRQSQNASSASQIPGSPANNPASQPTTEPVQQVTVAPVESETPKDPETPKNGEGSKVETETVKKDKTVVARDKAAAAKDTKRRANNVVQQDTDETDWPEVPEVNVPDVPTPSEGVTRRQFGGVTVRTLPDGTQIITQRNGTRILVRPDGTRQFLAPRRPIRRRVPPTP